MEKKNKNAGTKTHNLFKNFIQKKYRYKKTF